jgi:hypothetical protein
MVLSPVLPLGNSQGYLISRIFLGMYLRALDEKRKEIKSVSEYFGIGVKFIKDFDTKKIEEKYLNN